MSSVEQPSTGQQGPDTHPTLQGEAGANAPIPDHAIVVGLDDSPASAAALEWAAREADTRELPLHLIHTVQPPLWPDSDRVSEFDGSPAGCVIDARRAVANAFPRLPMSWSQHYGSALPALTWASRFATLIAVGTRAHGPIRKVLAGSTSIELIADAHCPIVVLRGAPEQTNRSGPIVVGLKGDESDGDALPAAFREADARHRTLVAVHASDYGFMEQVRIERMVTAVHRHYPGVGVKVHVKRGDSAELLVGRSRQASLLVLGTHGRHEAAGVVLGSVSQDVLRHAECPVMVARRGTLRPFGSVPETETDGSSHGQ